MVWLLFLPLGPFKVVDRRKVPRTGGLLILSNHISDIDPIAVQYGSPRHVRFMAKSELFSIKVLNWFMIWFGAFPVRRGAPDRVALKHAINLLKAGESVCVYPEGRLSKDGELQPLLPGAMVIAKQSECPMICCYLKNTNKVMPYGTLIPRPSGRRVTIIWGEIRQFDSDASIEEITEWADAELRRLQAIVED